MGVLDEWRFCPRCAAAITVSGPRAECASCGYVTYANPATSVCALVVREGCVLLGRRAAEPSAGKWDLPGGFVEEGEDALDALRRELQEETGLEIDVGEFVGAFADRYGDRGTLNLYWIAAAAGEPVAADDVSELRWFSRGELPAEEEIAFSNVAEVLRRWQQQA